jgi:glycosyltransferase involved in cell wall biosynthesis
VRILHITDDFQFTGGIRSYLVHLVETLRDQSHEAEVYSPTDAEDVSDDLFRRWISPHYLKTVRKVISRFRPDVLHAHSISMRLSPWPLRAALERNIPVIMTVHDFNYVCPRKWVILPDNQPCTTGFGWRCLVSNCRSSPQGWRYLPYHDLRWFKVLLHRRMLPRFVDTFVCPSRALSDWMQKSMHLSNVTHIPNFIRHPPSAEASFPDPFHLLFVGRLSSEKGVDVLISALPLILQRHPEAHLSIIGDGPERSDLQDLARGLGVEKHTNFMGQLDNTQLGAHYLQSAVCIQSSRWLENGPISGIEALAYGRPLVAADTGGLPEMVDEGVTGFTFERDNQRDLAAKVMKLLGRQDLLREFGENARKRFENIYTVERHVEELLSIYAEALKKGAKS